MKFTKIKSLKDKPFSTSELASELVGVLAKKGFLTDVKETSPRGFVLSINKASFFIDTEKLGCNLRPAHGTLTKYKRTNIPTWGQRVEYNLTVQKFLNKKGLVCKVTSGGFLIKDYERDYVENDWHYQSHSNMEIVRCHASYDAEEKAARKAHRDANKPIPSNAEKFILGIKKGNKNGRRKNSGIQESDRGTPTEPRTNADNIEEAV
jgi:hypothetical protein